MVKNEEANLERCLQSLQPIRDGLDAELIIVDTGSTDNTVGIAKNFTNKIYFHQWDNNFSEMRNISIGYATGKWIFIIDADEQLEDCQPLIDFLRLPKRDKYGSVAITVKNMVDLENNEYSSMIAPRFFKNDGYFRFEGVIHNQPVFKGEALAIPQVYLLHFGYLPTDKELMERKFQRTGTILKSELEKDPKNIYYWTQLSVTYGMHKDFPEAIEYAEKAYSLLPKKRTPKHMFLFSHMALTYQHVKNYEKVEQICREAMTIKEGYLDIYFYYAEAHSMLKRNREAIIYYEKYLDLLDKREQTSKHDVTIIEYSLGCQELAYWNLSVLYAKEKEYDRALYYSKQITNSKYIKNNMVNTIECYLKLDQYVNVRKFYDKWVQEDWKSFFFENLDKIVRQYDRKVHIDVARNFCNVNHQYALLCNLIVEDTDNGYISEKMQQAVEKIRMESLPVYCSDIFYYLLKWHYPLEKIVVNFKEIWLTCAFDFVGKHHDDLCTVIYNYLQKYTCNYRVHEYKLAKTLARCAILLNKLSMDQYKELLDRYVQEGIHYLQIVYSPLILEGTMIYEVKNDEEAFLLYMYKAQIYRTSQPAEYVKCLRQALQVFPVLNSGIEMLLVEIQVTRKTEQNEFDTYKQEIKNRIQQLIDRKKMNEARIILEEYKSIVPNDMESILLESRILIS